MVLRGDKGMQFVQLIVAGAAWLFVTILLVTAFLLYIHSRSTNATVGELETAADAVRTEKEEEVRSELEGIPADQLVDSLSDESVQSIDRAGKARAKRATQRVLKLLRKRSAGKGDPGDH